jgi:hypothetical protein
MALEKTVTTPHGFEAINAYHRVEGLEIIGKDSMSFLIRGYKQPHGVPCFAEKRITAEYDIAGNNPIAQAYASVKKQAEFINAKDC